MILEFAFLRAKRASAESGVTVDAGNLQLIEAGRVYPTIQVALQIKAVCGCPWEGLLG